MSVNFPIRGSQVSVRPPICAICTPGDEPRIVLVQRGEGIRHWPNEGHRGGAGNEPISRKAETGKTAGSTPARLHPVTEPDSVTKTCNTCGKPVTGHGKVCNACRQAAYRERKAT